LVHLFRFLEDTTERFSRETGINTRFASEMPDASEVEMPQRVCRELARIVQEGLVNVRKHSGARLVLVRLSSNGGYWVLAIEDNGKGFPFPDDSPRRSWTNSGRTDGDPGTRPFDRGDLTIESNPGRGSRLEVRVPQHRESAYG